MWEGDIERADVTAALCIETTSDVWAIRFPPRGKVASEQRTRKLVVIPYTAVVTAKTGVKKWSRGQVVFSVSVKSLFAGVVKRSSSKNEGQNILIPVLAVTTAHMGVTNASKTNVHRGSLVFIGPSLTH